MEKREEKEKVRRKVGESKRKGKNRENEKKQATQKKICKEVKRQGNGKKERGKEISERIEKKREKRRKESYKKVELVASCPHDSNKFFDNFLKPSTQYKDPESPIAILGKNTSGIFPNELRSDPSQLSKPVIQASYLWVPKFMEQILSIW